MHYLIAPDKFKGCLTAEQVVAAIGEGIRQADPAATIDLCPLSDGGEGLVKILAAAAGGQLLTSRVTGPLPDMQVEAEWAMLPGNDGPVAVIEMATASGLALVPTDRRDPRKTTTYGTGELLVHAVKAGAQRILLGIGGSATVDAGLGCCQAAGLTILSLDGEPFASTDALTGGDLDRVYAIKRGRGSVLDRVPITVACDVTNPLCGPAGAAAVFGPQKGASPADLAWFDAQHGRLAEHSLALDAAQAAGAGAAGGLGFAMLAFFNARLERGIELVLDAIHFDQRLAAADVVITGEGCLDEQSSGGKTAYGVLDRAARLGKPVVGVAGRVDGQHPRFWKLLESSPRALPLADAMKPANARGLISKAVREFICECGGKP